MDAALIQQKITFGYAKAAQYLGISCHVYRPTARLQIDPTKLIGTLLAQFDPKPNFKAAVPSTFAHPQWYAGVDRTDLQLGDYLVSATDTYYVNALQAFTPTGCILCNDTATFYRPGADQVPGNGYYGGNPSGLGLELISNCPLSVLQGTKGEKDDSGVIAEGRQPWISVCMPYLGVELEVADLMVTSKGHRYILSSIEQSILGVRITAAYKGT